MSREQATDLAERIRKDMGLGDPIVDFEEDGMIDPSGPVRVEVRRVQSKGEEKTHWQVWVAQGSTRQQYSSMGGYEVKRWISEVEDERA